MVCVFTLAACFDISSCQTTTTEPPHVHDWTDWVVQSVASCTTYGYEFRNCRDCGIEDGIYTPECGHEYKWIYNESNDIIENICLRCEDVLNSLQPIEGTPGLEYYFDEDEDAYHVIGMGDCTEEHITVPSMHNGKLVTSIDVNAFYKCEFLKSITLSNNLFYIGVSAFQGCVNLETVNIGRSSMLIYIESYAFKDCASLKSIRLPEGLTRIYGSAFYNCDSLEEIDLPNSLEKPPFPDVPRLPSRLFPIVLQALSSMHLGAFGRCSAKHKVARMDFGSIGSRLIAMLFGTQRCKTIMTQ